MRRLRVTGLNATAVLSVVAGLLLAAPAARQASAQLYPDDTWDESVDGLLRHSRIMIDDDGYLYGTTLGHLFRVDPATLDVETLADEAYLFAEDGVGNLYFARGPSVFMYQR